MNSFSIPAYRITYEHFMRRIVLFAIFWIAVLGLTVFEIKQNDLSIALSISLFISVFILNTMGFVMYIRKVLKSVEHPVSCTISDEGLSLISNDLTNEEIFIPYSELFDVQRMKFPFDSEKFYLRISRKKIKEELLVYSNEVAARDFDETKKIIIEKINSTETTQ